MVGFSPAEKLSLTFLKAFTKVKMIEVLIQTVISDGEFIILYSKISMDIRSFFKTENLMKYFI